MASHAQKDKEKFFADLYALDDLEDEDDEIFTAAKNNSRRSGSDIQRGSRSGNRRSPRSAGRNTFRADNGLIRATDQTAVNGEEATKKRGRGGRRSSERTPPPTRLINSNSAPESLSSLGDNTSKPTLGLRRMQTEDPAPKMTKKAKKKEPEVPQIFAGQTFFFVPNNNRAVPRQRRIDKAILHGATWAKEWTPGVTHVIVELERKMKDIVKSIGQDQVPPHIALVWDNWLTESLGYKEMRDSTARRFQVKKEEPIKKSTPVTKAQRSSFQDDARYSSASEDEPMVGDSQPRLRDALDDTMNEVKATQHLPFDDFDGEVTPTSSFESDLSFGEAESEVNKGFQCMVKNDGTTKGMNPNAFTMDMLQEMANCYDRIGDTWRTLSYRKAIAALRKQKTKIETEEQARAITGIGGRMAAKIQEIVSTKRLRRLDNAKADPHEQALSLFTGIYGVGISIASKWITLGHTTLEDIDTKVDLTPNQRIGLEHYEDFAAKIPRAEVAEHARTVQEALRKFDPKLQLIVGGSYRRGKPESGDIDCLITKEGADIEHIHGTIMESVVPFLTRIGFFKVALASTHTRDDGSKWHGVSALPRSKVWRRIDLLFVPWDELGAALIYFTGNDIFNRSIRLLASKKGMRLNQHGLYKDVMRGRQRERITEGTLVEGQSEVRIFEVLGVPYRPPEDRNVE